MEGSEQAAETIRSSLSMDENPPTVHLVCSHDGSGVDAMMKDIENCIYEARCRLRARERLISAWDFRLLRHPELNRVLDLLETGSITVEPGEGEGLEAGIYGIPLIVGLTLVDPLMGEIKRIKKDLKLAIYFGLLMSYAVWLTCYFWLGTDLRAAILLAPLTVLGELPKTKDIDDNATMILFPLAGLMLLLPFL